MTVFGSRWTLFRIQLVEPLVGGGQGALENLEVMTPFGSAFARHGACWSPGTPASRARGFANGCWAWARKSPGVSLPPNTSLSLFTQLGLARRLRHTIGDIQDPAVLAKVASKPQAGFCFSPGGAGAGARVVRASAGNVCHQCHGHRCICWKRCKDFKQPCAAVFITTDKCYENREWHHGYREDDPWADAILTAPARRPPN